MAEVNRIEGITVGQYGEAIQLTIVDSDGLAVDVSGYDQTKTAYLRSPFDALVRTYTVTFVNTGTDGLVQFTPSAGDIDRPGKWKLQIKLTSTTVARLTVVADVIVEMALG